MNKIEELIEKATSRDFDYERGHTAIVDPEQLVRVVAEDCFNICKERALANYWEKSTCINTAKLIAERYGLEFKQDDFIKFTEVPPTTHVFSLDSWNESIEDGSIIDDDGCGYWMKGNLESDVDCFDTQPTWATHVSWYNK